MRRRDREIADRSEIDALLERAKVCRVAFAVDAEPYIVPLSLGYDAEANALYFHTAPEGRKIQCIAANPRVCFEVEGRIEVTSGDERGCTWSLSYESVIGTGKLVELLSPDDKEEALRCIMRQQSGREMPWSFAPRTVAVTRVWRLGIETVTGKRSLVTDSG